MRTAERVGELLLEAIVDGKLIRVELGCLSISANATEQLGQLAIRASERVSGHLTRKLNVQAETISGLHDKLAESKTHLKEAKKDVYEHRKAMWELAQIAARAICNSDAKDETYYSVLTTVITSVGFQPIHESE